MTWILRDSNLVNKYPLSDEWMDAMTTLTDGPDAQTQTMDKYNRNDYIGWTDGWMKVEVTQSTVDSEKFSPFFHLLFFHPPQSVSPRKLRIDSFNRN